MDSEILHEKFIDALEEINQIDAILMNKYERNTKDTELCKKLLEESNKYLYTIITNIKL